MTKPRKPKPPRVVYLVVQDSGEFFHAVCYSKADAEKFKKLPAVTSNGPVVKFVEVKR